MKVFLGRGVKFRSDFDDTQDRERETYQRLEIQKNLVIQSQVVDVIKRANELALTLTDASEEKQFIKQLVGYLQKRVLTISSSSDHAVLAHKARIVTTCIDAIGKNDLSAIISLLEDKNIKQIKGVFSSRMYEILSPFQKYPMKRRNTIFLSLPTVIPKSLQELINSYDGTMDIKVLQDDKENQSPQQNRV